MPELVDHQEDESLIDLLAKEDALKQSHDEVNTAIQARLNEGFGQAGEDWAHVYEHQLQGEEDFKEALFWQEEISNRLKEHADEILTRRLILQEKNALAERSTNSDSSQKDGEWAAEIAQVEADFEDATRNRHNEMDEQMAQKLQAAETAIINQKAGSKATAEPEARKRRMSLLNRLVTRVGKRT
jgi:hypothetical protein